MSKRMKILLMGTMLMVLVVGVTQAHAANAWWHSATFLVWRGGW